MSPTWRNLLVLWIAVSPVVGLGQWDDVNLWPAVDHARGGHHARLWQCYSALWERAVSVGRTNGAALTTNIVGIATNLVDMTNDVVRCTPDTVYWARYSGGQHVYPSNRNDHYVILEYKHAVTNLMPSFVDVDGMDDEPFAPGSIATNTIIPTSLLVRATMPTNFFSYTPWRAPSGWIENNGFTNEFTQAGGTNLPPGQTNWTTADYAMDDLRLAIQSLHAVHRALTWIENISYSYTDFGTSTNWSDVYSAYQAYTVRGTNLTGSAAPGITAYTIGKDNHGWNDLTEEEYRYTEYQLRAFANAARPKVSGIRTQECTVRCFAWIWWPQYDWVPEWGWTNGVWVGRTNQSVVLRDNGVFADWPITPELDRYSEIASFVAQGTTSATGSFVGLTNGYPIVREPTERWDPWGPEYTNDVITDNYYRDGWLVGNTMNTNQPWFTGDTRPIVAVTNRPFALIDYTNSYRYP